MVASDCMRRHLENKPVAVEATQRGQDKACRLRHATALCRRDDSEREQPRDGGAKGIA